MTLERDQHEPVAIVGMGKTRPSVVYLYEIVAY